jgi:hypothetical protein
VDLQRLTRRYGDLVALDELSFTVAEGQTFAFVGPNGAGTTTAMRTMLGVLEPDAGQGAVARTTHERRSAPSRRIHRRGPRTNVFYDSSLDSRHSSSKTLCQFGQQTQHPPTYPPCRCGKTERHARQEQPAVQVRRRQLALNAQTIFAFQAPDPTARSGQRLTRALLSGCPSTRPAGSPCRCACADAGTRGPRWRPRPGGQRSSPRCRPWRCGQGRARPAVVPGDQAASSSKVLAQVDTRERSLGAPVVLEVPDP